MSDFGAIVRGLLVIVSIIAAVRFIRAERGSGESIEALLVLVAIQVTLARW